MSQLCQQHPGFASGLEPSHLPGWARGDTGPCWAVLSSAALEYSSGVTDLSLAMCRHVSADLVPFCSCVCTFFWGRRAGERLRATPSRAQAVQQPPTPRWVEKFVVHFSSSRHWHCRQRERIQSFITGALGGWPVLHVAHVQADSGSQSQSLPAVAADLWSFAGRESLPTEGNLGRPG